MGIGLCEKCIKKYYPRINWDKGMILGSWSCEKCGEWPCKGFYGRSGIKAFEKTYRYNTEWLPKHRKTMGKRKGVKRCG